MQKGIAFVAVIVAGWIVPAEAQQKAESKTVAAKKKSADTAKTQSAVPDLSMLSPFRNALLDLKAAVEVGVSREDYQRKLQTAKAEGLKAEARLPDDDDTKPGIVRQCFMSYQLALLTYQRATSQWDILLTNRRGNAEGLPGYDDAVVSKAEDDLHAIWKSADDKLNDARSCTKVKSN
jgi:hypothetical protein